MICISCEESKTEVVDSRHYKDPNKGYFYVERRRRCVNPECNFLFTTIEKSLRDIGSDHE